MATLVVFKAEHIAKIIKCKARASAFVRLKEYQLDFGKIHCENCLFRQKTY